MGFSWAGAGYGASQAAQQQRREAEEQRRYEAEQALRQEEHGLRTKLLLAQLAASEQGQKNATAATTLQQLEAMGQGAEVAPEAAARIAGTPYDVRLQKKTELASASLPGLTGAPGDTGSGGDDLQNYLTDKFASARQREYVTLQPTVAQQREAGERARFEALRTDASLPAPARKLIDLEQMGVRGLNVHDIEGPQAHQAHIFAEQDRSHQKARELANYTHGLAVARDDKNEQRGEKFTRKDLLQVMRDARTRAVADYKVMADPETGILLGDDNQPVAVDDLADQYFQESLTALEAFDELQPAASGRKLVTGLRARINPSMNPQAGVRARPRIVEGVVRRVPAGGAAPSGKTISQAELAATAQRMGIPVEQAAQMARDRGLAVR